VRSQAHPSFEAVETGFIPVARALVVEISARKSRSVIQSDLFLLRRILTFNLRLVGRRTWYKRP
jgi:hypothetical protein